MGKHKDGAPWKDTKAFALARSPGEHTDPGLAGFGMRVSPKLKAVWTVKTSIGSGKERKFSEVTLGLVANPGDEPDGVNALSLKQAREKASSWIEEKRLPATERERRAQRGALCLENLLDEFLENRRTKSGHKLASSTKQFYRNVFARYLQDCKNWSLVELQYSPRQWLEVLQKAEKRSVSWANGSMALISAVYDYLELLGTVDANPIRRVRKTRIIRKPKVRDTHIATLDLPRFVQQLHNLRNKHSCDALKINLLAGWRSTAVLGLLRERVDLQARSLSVKLDDPGWKRWVGEYPINRYVLEILNARDATGKDSLYVFPARHGDKKHMQNVRGSAAIASKGCPLVATPHILRRTFATIANIVFPGDITLHGALLAHKWATPERPEAATTVGYIVSKERLEAASTRVASVILQIGGIEDMTEETLRLLNAAAIDTTNLQLVEIEDDDDDEPASNADTKTDEKLVA